MNSETNNAHNNKPVLTPSLFSTKTQPFDTPSSFIKRPLPVKSPIVKDGNCNQLGDDSNKDGVVAIFNDLEKDIQKEDFTRASPYKRTFYGNRLEFTELHNSGKNESSSSQYKCASIA
jgi:hypothetical protein